MSDYPIKFKGDGNHSKVELYGRKFRHYGILWLDDSFDRPDYILRHVHETAQKFMGVDFCNRIKDVFPTRFLEKDVNSRTPYVEECPLFKVKKWWVAPKWRGARYQMDCFTANDRLCFVIWARTDAEIENAPYAGTYDDEDSTGRLTDYPPDARLVQERYRPKRAWEVIER